MSAPTAARRVAFEVVRRTFEHDAWADRALRSAADRYGLGGRDRAQAQRLAYGAVQRRGTSDALIERLARRQPSELDPPLLAALRLGLFELLFSEGVAEHAAVTEAVELAKGGMRAAGAPGRADAAAGLVNAVLRRAARSREELLAWLDDSTAEGAATAHSLPTWIADLWWEELGPETARGVMAAANEPLPRAVRVNSLRVDPAELRAGLREDGAEVEAPGERWEDPLAPPEAVMVSGRWGPPLRERLAAGELVAQSLASQAVVHLLDPVAGERVLDLCAGPGIKSTGIAARMEDRGQIVSVEAHSGRASQIEELCGRLGVSCVEVMVADAASADLGEGYDRVLVDPPCTDLGALASRPDARWRKSPEQLARLASLQEAVLTAGARALRPGGALVYATCTISRGEGEEVVDAVVEADPRLEAERLGGTYPRLASTHDERFLQTRPDRDRTSGFFIARLRRRG